MGELAVPDRGDVRAELVELLRGQLGAIESEAREIYAILGGRAFVNPAVPEPLWELVQRRKAAVTAVLERGVGGGQIREGVDLDLAFFLLWGPIYYRYLAGPVGPIEHDFIDRVVDRVLAGIGVIDPKDGAPADGA